MDAYPALALNADMRPLSVAPLSVWTFRRVLAREMLGK
ncbi:MAG: HNH endonuclease, partial [Mesorhizobium amorphae]